MGHTNDQHDKIAPPKGAIMAHILVVTRICVIGLRSHLKKIEFMPCVLNIAIGHRGEPTAGKSYNT